MNYYSYANGKIIKKDNIKIGISDLVMLRGYGVFDYMRTYAGKPFLVHDYISRFSNSAKEMKLKLPLSNDKIEKIIYTLLKKNQKKNQVKEFGIRFLLTGGYSLDSFLPSTSNSEAKVAFHSGLIFERSSPVSGSFGLNTSLGNS